MKKTLEKYSNDEQNKKKKRGKIENWCIDFNFSLVVEQI